MATEPQPDSAELDACWTQLFSSQPGYRKYRVEYIVTFLKDSCLEFSMTCRQ